MVAGIIVDDVAPATRLKQVAFIQAAYPFYFLYDFIV